MAEDCKLLLVWKDILFFAYCVISEFFTGLIKFLPVMDIIMTSVFRVDSWDIHVPSLELSRHEYRSLQVHGWERHPDVAAVTIDLDDPPSHHRTSQCLNQTTLLIFQATSVIKSTVYVVIKLFICVVINLFICVVIKSLYVL